MTDVALRLDHRSRIPLHLQAEQLLRELIRQPEYRRGQYLPNEVTLARQLGISRNTLRAGIARMMFEGLLERRAGVGTRAVTRPLQSGIAQWHSFTREMQRKGIDAQSFALDVRIVKASEAVSAALQINAGRAVLRLDRLRGWNERPVVHFRSFLHPRLGLGGEEDFTGPLYQLIEARSGVSAEGSREELRAVPADAALARLLRVPRGTPLLRRDRSVHDASGRPIEYAVVHYLSSHFALTLDIRRDRP